MINFNINQYVKVKLTETGLDELRRRHKRYVALAPQTSEKLFTRPKVDDQGYSSFQLWDLMNTFGHLCRMDSELPFDPNIIILDESV